MKYTGTSTRAKPRGRVAMYMNKTRGFLMLYMFYITTTPYLSCNNKNINRKELYDFYYTAITLTTGYKSTSSATQPILGLGALPSSSEVYTAINSDLVDNNYKAPAGLNAIFLALKDAPLGSGINFLWCCNYRKTSI